MSPQQQRQKLTLAIGEELFTTLEHLIVHASKFIVFTYDVDIGVQYVDLFQLAKFVVVERVIHGHLSLSDFLSVSIFTIMYCATVKQPPTKPKNKIQSATPEPITSLANKPTAMANTLAIPM